jgi:hypothetical protein
MSQGTNNPNQGQEPSGLKKALVIGGLVLQGLASIAAVSFMSAIGKEWEKDGDGNWTKPWQHKKPHDPWTKDE